MKKKKLTNPLFSLKTIYGTWDRVAEVLEVKPPAVHLALRRGKLSKEMAYRVMEEFEANNMSADPHWLFAREFEVYEGEKKKKLGGQVAAE